MRSDIPQVLLQNQKRIAQAIVLQSGEQHLQALEKLEAAFEVVMDLSQKLQKRSNFYSKVMPVLKQQRQLIPQAQYDHFWSKSEAILSQNLERDAYISLLMQELESEQHLPENPGTVVHRKWEASEENQLMRFMEEKAPLAIIMCHFKDRTERQIKKKINHLLRTRN